MGAKFTFQQLQQRLLVRWWFRWPQIRLAAAERRDMMSVNNSQCPTVPGAFVTVTAQQSPDSVGATELLR